jgi:hypothetical protein
MLSSADSSMLISVSRRSLCHSVVLKTAGLEDLLAWKACVPAALLRQLLKIDGGHMSKQ